MQSTVPIRYHVPVASVTKEAHFYEDAAATSQHISSFKEKLKRREEELGLLTDYYYANGGKIDVFHRPIYGPRAMRANLGTADQTWYYLDARGNKVWVRDMKLDTSSPASGAFDAQCNSSDRIVVVQVPKTRRNYDLPYEYKQRCEAFDASTKRGGISIRHESSLAIHNKDEIDRYVDMQQRVAKEIESLPLGHRPEYVYRPPSSVEEAEQRLAELKAEEARLVSGRSMP
jgi:hypothetical protein